jgi:hypothetical protein
LRILDWADEMAKKGLYDQSTSRNLRTALRDLLTVLDANDSRDPRSLLAQMDSLAERWARINRANPTTMKTYRQRATQLLEDYIAFMENPGSFKGRGGGNAPKKTDKKGGRLRWSAAEPVEPEHVRLPNGKIVTPRGIPS